MILECIASSEVQCKRLANNYEYGWYFLKFHFDVKQVNFTWNIALKISSLELEP